MADEIINRVANSKLVTFDLEDHYPEGLRTELDISPWLWEGFVLKEKEFRQYVKEHDWSLYQDGYLAVYNSSEAIIPAWALMLISLHAAPYTKKVVSGRLADLEMVIFTELIDNLNLSSLKDKPVVIKGCTGKFIPENAYLLLAQKLRPIAKSIMYGEACSSVPLFKASKG